MGVQDGEGYTAFMLAAESGHEQVTRVLLKAGAVLGDRNNVSVTALMVASLSGHEQCVRGGRRLGRS